MSKSCAKCEKTVYPLEELKCLDKVCPHKIHKVLPKSCSCLKHTFLQKVFLQICNKYFLCLDMA